MNAFKGNLHSRASKPGAPTKMSRRDKVAALIMSLIIILIVGFTAHELNKPGGALDHSLDITKEQALKELANE